MPNNEVLRLEGVSKEYVRPGHSISVLHDVALAVEAGDIVHVRGPSGSGKTTLLRLASCLDTPSAGMVSVCGQSVHSEKERDEARAAHIGILFQDFNLISHMSVRDNILLACEGRGDNRARALLERFSLAQIAERRCAHISGGEAQRTALCRALINNPQILFADEPTSALDDANADVVLEQFSELAEREKLAVMVASHDMRLSSIATRAVSIRAGKLVEESLSHENRMDGAL